MVATPAARPLRIKVLNPEPDRLDPRLAGGLGVVPECVDVLAEYRLTQDEPGKTGERQEQNTAKRQEGCTQREARVDRLEYPDRGMSKAKAQERKRSLGRQGAFAG